MTTRTPSDPWPDVGDTDGAGSERERSADPGGRGDGARRESRPPPQGGAVTLAPHTNDRIFAVGSTGSGKTTLMLGLLSGVRKTPIVIVDTKGDDVIARFTRSHGFYETNKLAIPSEKYPRVVIHGPPSGEWWDPLFWAVMRLDTGCVVYVDELTHLTNPWKVEPGLANGYSNGRGRRVGFWGGSQRPSRIAVGAMSEADHFFAFRLGWPDDEDVVARLIRFGRMRFSSNSLPDYAFAYKTHRLRQPIVGRAITPIV